MVAKRTVAKKTAKKPVVAKEAKTVAPKTAKKTAVKKKTEIVTQKTASIADDFKETIPEEFIPDALVIRTSLKDGTSKNNFQWPLTLGALVEAPDWEATAKCGRGLHGLLDGVGHYEYLNSDKDALWWVIGVKRDECITIDDDKVKYPRGKVLYFGDSRGAIRMLVEDRMKDSIVKDKKNHTAGDSSHSSTAGNYAHSSTAGEFSHSSTAGEFSHSSTAGNSSHSSTAGYYAHSSTAGDFSHSSTAGEYSHSSTAGNYAHSSTAGYSSHSSTAGNSSHSSTTGEFSHSSTAGYSAHSSTAGYYAHSSTAGNSAHSSTAGYSAHSSTAGYSAHSSTAGDSSIASGLGITNKAKASACGAIVLTHWGVEDCKYVLKGIKASMVGENGIRPDTFYMLNDQGEFVEVD